MNSGRLVRSINGVFLLDKPVGISSNNALQQVKRLYQAKKAGHGGSLDPLASGMLPIGFGEATKFINFMLDANKQYHVIAQLGQTTTTGDSEGEVVRIRELEANKISRQDILAVLPRFRGRIIQIPPVYSALKYQGQPLYRLARKGVIIQPQAREVKIDELHFLSKHQNCIEFKVSCSKGTYIRTLIEDIGEALGCGAFVTKLRRVSVGHFSTENMYRLSDLQVIAEQLEGIAKLESMLIPVDSFVQPFPALILEDIAVKQVRQGKKIILNNPFSVGINRLYQQNGEFIGLGYCSEDNILTAHRLIAT